DLFGKTLQLCFYSLAVRHVSPRADDLPRLAFVIARDRKGILNPNVVPVAMPKAVLQSPSALADQSIHVAENTRSILGMKPLNPEFLVVSHLPRGISHDRVQILADERAGIVPRHLGGIDDRRTGPNQRFEVVHQGHALSESKLGLLSTGDISPGSDDFQRAPLVVFDDPESILDPDVMSVPMPESIF